ncbi:MAG: MMPL family transporter [Acidimicrobiia bacterium]|nr:MMPL family transporter [Acidimicrobiia bacterium]
MSNALYRLGRMAAGRPLRVIGVWALLAVLVIGASAVAGEELQDSMAVPGLDSQQAVELLAAAHSDAAGVTAEVVLTPRDSGITFFDSSPAATGLAEVQRLVAGLPHVIGTTDPAGALEAGSDAAIASGSFSPDGRIALIRVQYPVVEDLSVADLEAFKAFADEAAAVTSLQVELSGDLFSAFESTETNAGEMIGLVVAAVILLVAFGSIIAMGLPIGVALFGIVLGVSAMPLISRIVDIPSFAPEMGSMIGIGVGIDYALFLVTRHREHLAQGMTVVESAGRAAATAGQAIVFAGGTVVIAILGMAVAGIPFMTAGGLATAVIVFIMVMASITLLPAFLGLAGHRMKALKQGRKAGFGAGGWMRWGRHVSKNAAVYAVGTTLLLLALTAPVLGLRLGFPDDGTLPESRTERRAYDLVAEGFGPGANGPLLVAIDISEDGSVVTPLVEAVAADAGIASVVPPIVDEAAGVATLVAYPTTAPQDGATVDTINRLRGDVFPTVLDGSQATAHVGGLTASFADMGEKVADRLPFFIGTVILLSFVLLTLLFRSILVPLKAALLNLLSIGAAYGVLVMVFQWGWGMGFIGLESTVPIISFIPMFMFAVLFGLSMDYEVFLLSRVREDYIITRDNEGSVIRGIGSTARVITSAALIMISVFGGFVLGSDPTIKMVGIGLATAIFVDATIVRMVLVPATMKLMGDANWWLPGWLDRLLPTIHMEGEAGLPAPQMVADTLSEEPVAELVSVS